MSKLDVYLPDNLNDGRHFFGIPDRNLVETLVLEAGILKLLWMTPLVLTWKLTIMSVFAIMIGLTGILGYKDKSLTEALYSWYRHKHKQHHLKYRRVELNVEKYEENSFKDKSDKAIRDIENFFADRYEQHLKEKYEKKEGIS